MHIVVDAFGGDNAPLAPLKGAALAAGDGVTVTLVGNEEILRRVAKEENISLDGITIVHTEDVIAMEDEPRTILKAHKDCSMAVGLRMVAEGKGDAFVSAGSTGALVMGATFFVKRIKGVPRAAIATLIPTASGRPSLMLDSGANAECRPEMLCQFAQMGSVYMSRVMGGGEPATVGLINIGTEECKGGELQQQAYRLIQESGVNFVGNVESREVPFGAADVLVTDGFTGNILLKAIEGTAGMLMKEIKSLFMSNLLTKIAALLVKSKIGVLKSRMSTSEHGGAPILGVCRPVIKAHGNSDAAAIRSAIRIAGEFAATGVIEAITEAAKGSTSDE
ncbi:MAG: phosphate acyltransferase PlsX [Ruminococcaceae bacterium]|nr:phosphate acyltransferase PlsX [Oscillospiraceae bacterium]